MASGVRAPLLAMDELEQGAWLPVAHAPCGKGLMLISSSSGEPGEVLRGTAALYLSLARRRNWVPEWKCQGALGEGRKRVADALLALTEEAEKTEGSSHLWLHGVPELRYDTLSQKTETITLGDREKT